MTRVQEENQHKIFNIGDRVIADNNMSKLLAYHLPAYLTGGALTVIGFTRTGRVLCDWDGGKPFSIPSHILHKIEDRRTTE